MQQEISTHTKFNHYDPLQPDAYVLHLANIHHACGVAVIEDIYDLHGVLIVAKSAAMTPVLAHYIMQYTLLKPLENCIELARELNLQRLEKDFSRVMQQDQILSALHEHDDLVVVLQKYCQQYSEYPLLRQKLTVLALSMPDLYSRTLHCSWLSLLIAKEMRLSEQDIAAIFLAALSHDIGMLHVDPAVLESKVALSFDDWQKIQMHVVVGHQLLVSMANMPHLVAQAVFEHHERCDGTGYPLGKVESELSVAGQIVGLADSVMAIYHNRFKSQGHSWRDVIPIIQMNLQAYFFRHCDVLLSIIRRSELPIKNVIDGDETPQFIAELAEKNNHLKKWFETMRETIMALGFRHGDRRLHALQNVMLHVSTSIDGSGIFNIQYSELLVAYTAKTSTDIHRDIESAHRLQLEIIFHLQRLSRMTQLYIESGDCKDEKILTALVSGLHQSQKFLL
jgi:HD-GYP domain-containing protein (c-di-GMP phosphodiesterase class II)